MGQTPEQAVAEVDEGGTTSPWMDVEIRSEPGPHDVTATTADVCVIGAGIAGLSTAYLLAAEGRSVVVLDDGKIGGGETSRTTAHLASYLDDRFTILERLHGPGAVSYTHLDVYKRQCSGRAPAS